MIGSTHRIVGVELAGRGDDIKKTFPRKKWAGVPLQKQIIVGARPSEPATNVPLAQYIHDFSTKTRLQECSVPGIASEFGGSIRPYRRSILPFGIQVSLSFLLHPYTASGRPGVCLVFPKNCR